MERSPSPPRSPVPIQRSATDLRLRSPRRPGTPKPEPSVSPRSPASPPGSPVSVGSLVRIERLHPPIRRFPEVLESRPVSWCESVRAALRVSFQMSARDGLCSQAVGVFGAVPLLAAARVVSVAYPVARIPIAGAAACAMGFFWWRYQSRGGDLFHKGVVPNAPAWVARCLRFMPITVELLGAGAVGLAGGGFKVASDLVFLSAARELRQVVRDYCQTRQRGAWDALELVQPDGSSVAAEQAGRVKKIGLALATVGYTVLNLVTVLWVAPLVAELMETAGLDESTRSGDQVRAAAAALIPTILLEAADGINYTFATLAAALADDKRLRVDPADRCGALAENMGADLDKTHALALDNAAMRTWMGSPAGAPWQAALKLVPKDSTAALVLRILAALAGGLTETRSTVMQRGREFEAAARELDPAAAAIDQLRDAVVRRHTVFGRQGPFMEEVIDGKGFLVD